MHDERSAELNSESVPLELVDWLRVHGEPMKGPRSLTGKKAWIPREKKEYLPLCHQPHLKTASRDHDTVVHGELRHLGDKTPTNGMVSVSEYTGAREFSPRSDLSDHVLRTGLNPLEKVTIYVESRRFVPILESSTEEYRAYHSSAL